MPKHHPENYFVEMRYWKSHLKLRSQKTNKSVSAGSSMLMQEQQSLDASSLDLNLDLCLHFTGCENDFQFPSPSTVHMLLSACKFPWTVSHTMWIHRIVVMALVLIAVIAGVAEKVEEVG